MVDNQHLFIYDDTQIRYHFQPFLTRPSFFRRWFCFNHQDFSRVRFDDDEGYYPVITWGLCYGYGNDYYYP